MSDVICPNCGAQFDPETQKAKFPPDEPKEKPKEKPIEETKRSILDIFDPFAD